MIELLGNMGNDNTVANAARQSFGNESWFELPDNYSEDQRDRLISYLAKHRHMTPFRHNAQTIQCKMPIFLARQLGKHQAGLSWNEKSRRYTTDNIEFHTPFEWRNAPENGIKQGSHGVSEFSDKYKIEYENLIKYSEEVYVHMISDGIAPEQARMVLPQSMMVDIVWTGNLLAFAHIYNERIAPGAQLEAREFAKQLGDIMIELYPISWKSLCKNKYKMGVVELNDKTR